MAVSDVRVNIKDAYVISACNTPGGPVAEWRNKTEHDLLVRCYATSPVNDELNAKHRKSKPVGEFQRSWVSYRWGNQHRIGFNIENFAGHALFVEEGRSESRKYQVFSWTEWGGEIKWVGALNRTNFRKAGNLDWGGPKTGARDGKHILRNATNHVLAKATGGSYVPLT